MVLELYHEAAWPDPTTTLAALAEDVAGAGPELERLYDDTFGQEEDGEVPEDRLSCPAW